MKIGPGEITLILIIAVMIFGAGKIPEIGKQLGRSIRDFKKYSSDDAGQVKTQKETQAQSKAPEAVEAKTVDKV